MEQPYWIYTKDDITGAEYISLSNNSKPRAFGTKVLREGLMIDLDVDGKVIGVEILPPTTEELLELDKTNGF